jgi:hypothetical protein
MNKFDTIFNKKDIPDCWEEISRSDNGLQLDIRLGHINPGDKADKLMTSERPATDVDGNPIVIHSISVPGTMTAFFDSMMTLAQSGLIPTIKPEDISSLRSQYNSVRDEKFDVDLSISIVDYKSEAAATEGLENLDPTHPRTVSGKSLGEIFTDPRVMSNFTEEQLKMIANLPAQMAQMQADIQAKNKGRYYQDSFLGCPALFLEMDNPVYQQYIKPKPVTGKNSKKLRGGGFDTMSKPRPKAAPPPARLLNCLGIRVGNYLVAGSLLNNIFYYPSGTEYCHSLTMHDTVVKTERIEGHTYTTIHWLPTDSTMAAEGYLNREEITAMLQTIINQLKAMV